jgi:hypothetical protein
MLDNVKEQFPADRYLHIGDRDLDEQFARQAGFEFLWKHDPFSGHVVIRSTDAETPGSAYRLWTTLKVPQGFSLIGHCELLLRRIGADAFRAMPAKRLFAWVSDTCVVAEWSPAARRTSWVRSSTRTSSR